MKSVRSRSVTAGLATLAMTVGIVGGSAGAALAAYNPSSPPYPVDPNNVASLKIYDATTGAVVTSGSSTTTLDNYDFVASSDFNPGHTKAAVFGFLAVTGQAPGSWSGQQLGLSTTYPVSSPASLTSAPGPVARGSSSYTFDSLAGTYPNTASSSSDFYQLYQLRVQTTFPTPASQTYAYGDIQIDPVAHTWKQVGPAPAAATATSTTLSASPVSPQVSGTMVTLSATETPAAAGSVEFFDGATSLGAATVSSGTASLPPITPTVGTHSYKATFTPSDTAAFAPSTSAVSSYTVTAAPTAPAAPTGVTATPGDTSATVSWTAPNDGGSAITKYTVTFTPSGGMPTSVDVMGTSTTLSGLVNGTQYSVTVSATNGVGTGPSSSAVTVTPKAPTAPDAPTALAATPGNGQLALTWTAPAANGSAITGYEVTSTPAGGTPTTVSTGSTATSYTLSGLTNGTAYTVTVAAVNGVGTGPDSAAVTATPGTVPGAPTGVSAVAHDGSATVSFTAPANDGGFAVTGYTVTASTGETATGTSSPITVPGLANGTSRTFTVKASNAKGVGPASAASNAVAYYVPTLSITTSAPVITSGGYYRISGKLTGGVVAGQRVALGVFEAGKSPRAIIFTTSSTGTFSTSFQGVVNTSFRAYFDGTATERAVQSYGLVERVATKVTVASPANSLRTGTRRLAVTGSTSPDKAGQAVYLYERRSGRNVLIAKATVASNGSYRFVYTFAKGTHVYLVGIHATSTNAAGVSAYRTLYEV
ncbi:MAG: fibronectin type III domain-containing protein [Nocardioides sp.]